MEEERSFLAPCLGSEITAKSPGPRAHACSGYSSVWNGNGSKTSAFVVQICREHPAEAFVMAGQQSVNHYHGSMVLSAAGLSHNKRCSPGLFTSLIVTSIDLHLISVCVNNPLRRSGGYCHIHTVAACTCGTYFPNMHRLRTTGRVPPQKDGVVCIFSSPSSLE